MDNGSQDKTPGNGAPTKPARGDIFEKARNYDEADQVMALGVYPYFRRIDEMLGTQVVCEGKRLVMIGSNNYLGLAHDARVKEASAQAIQKFGSGCTGSRFLNGNIALHEELESALADYLQREEVLLFSTGFFANLGTLATLCEDGDVILSDRENHASILDGCQMSRAKIVPYIHNSIESLRKRLARLPEECGKLIVADGVFSMSGDIVDLPGVMKAAQEFGARVYIDEAHSLGILGPNGEGAVHHYGLNKETDLVMGTFSKSLGSMGGFIAGPSDVIKFLKHRTRCFIFSASLAPAISGGVLKALEIIRAEPERLELLWKNTRKMHAGFKSIGFNIGTTQTPIVPLLIGSETKAFFFTKMLYEAGVFATPAVYPAVRYGQSMVRTSYMATHKDEELDFVLTNCEKIAKKLGIFEDAAYTGENVKKQVNNGYDFSLYQESGAQAL